MNTHKQIRSGAWGQVLVAAAIALAGAGMSGCSTTVYKQGDRAADAAQAAAVQVQTENQALAATQTTLNALVDQTAADLKPQFLSFGSALDALVRAAKQTEARGNHLARGNAAYIAAWDKQLTTITNTEIRSRSEARKTEVSNQFEAAHKRFLRAQEAVRPLIGYWQDVRKALSTDLTPGGLEAVKGLVGNANTTAGKVQADLAQAVADLKALSASMSSAKAPTAN